MLLLCFQSWELLISKGLLDDNSIQITKYLDYVVNNKYISAGVFFIDMKRYFIWINLLRYEVTVLNINYNVFHELLFQVHDFPSLVLCVFIP